MDRSVDVVEQNEVIIDTLRRMFPNIEDQALRQAVQSSEEANAPIRVRFQQSIRQVLNYRKSA